MKCGLLSVFFLLSLSALCNGANLYCYFTSWTVYRPGNGKFDVTNIDPSLCTHAAFTFVGINEDGSLDILDPWESDDDGLKGFSHFVALKDSNPNLKIFVSIGGWNEGSEKYSEVIADASKRKVLANDLEQFLEQHSFDGVDFDWEYPGRRDSTNSQDKENFATFLKELSQTLKPKGHLLSAAVVAAARYIDISYDVDALDSALDFINVMAYDFHGSFEPFVGHHTPLYASHLDAQHNNSDWNIDAGIKGWIDRGVDVNKVNLGLATYARTFTLADPSNTALYAPITGGGDAGPYTRQDGILGFNELCELHSNYERHWDDEQKVPHKISGSQWVGYEDEESLGIKVNYGLDKKLGGFMVWSYDTDDFLGICGNGSYPLIHSIINAIKVRGHSLN